MLVFCCLASACSKSGNTSSYDAEWEAKSKQQFADYDRQTKAVDANLAVMERQSKRVDVAQDKADEQAQRLDRLLERWEAQARRQDAILEAQEKKLGITKWKETNSWTGRWKQPAQAVAAHLDRNKWQMTESHFNGPLTRLFCSTSQPQPDPWPEEVDAAIRHPTATPLCISCLTPQARDEWFCPHCAFPTGDFVPLMPYLQIFPVAEVLRRGVIGPPERRLGVQLFLVALSFSQYTLFAPVYWFWMLRRARGRPICPERRKDIVFDEIA
jgi:hypothetical protein